MLKRVQKDIASKPADKELVALWTVGIRMPVAWNSVDVDEFQALLLADRSSAFDR